MLLTKYKVKHFITKIVYEFTEREKAHRIFFFFNLIVYGWFHGISTIDGLFYAKISLTIVVSNYIG